jgi:hypothetical protein
LPHIVLGRSNASDRALEWLPLEAGESSGPNIVFPGLSPLMYSVLYPPPPAVAVPWNWWQVSHVTPSFASVASSPNGNVAPVVTRAALGEWQFTHSRFGSGPGSSAYGPRTTWFVSEIVSGLVSERECIELAQSAAIDAWQPPHTFALANDVAASVGGGAPPPAPGPGKGAESDLPDESCVRRPLRSRSLDEGSSAQASTTTTAPRRSASTHER